MTPPLITPKKRIALLKALASPARIEVVEVMQISGPATVAEISTQLGRAADSLYHHLRQLEKAGIVERQGKRQSGGRSGAVYALCEREVSADSSHESPVEERAAMADLGAAILRLTERDMRTALTDDWETESSFAGLHDFPLVQRTKGWLNPAQAAVALAKIQDVLGYMREHAVCDEPGESGARLFALSQVLSPVPARRKHRSPATETKETQ
ncbi:MAG: DNA-binding transcriptional ArsR family regulator [Planctomycetota bacterium]|jgi:DNA-binding transcriptional ArsR family regulator